MRRYFSQGYMGYTFNKQSDPEGGFSPDKYPCPRAASLGSNSQTNSTGQWFCTLTTEYAAFGTQYFPSSLVFSVS